MNNKTHKEHAKNDKGNCIKGALIENALKRHLEPMRNYSVIAVYFKCGASIE